MRLLDADARPVGFHFLRHDQRQAGAHACSHLGAVRDDRYDAVGSDRDEDARIDHDAVRHLARAGLVGEGRARHDRRGQHESAGEAEALEDAAARNVLDLDVLFKATELVGVCDDVHDHTPVDASFTAFSMRW